jgi:hypothetical protein
VVATGNVSEGDAGIIGDSAGTWSLAGPGDALATDRGGGCIGGIRDSDDIISLAGMVTLSDRARRVGDVVATTPSDEEPARFMFAFGSV